LSSTTAYLFVRRAYEKMGQFWPHQPDTNPIAAHLNRAVKYVASRTLDDAVWALVDVTPTTTGVVMLTYEADR
jgi:hypothetical protein